MRTVVWKDVWDQLVRRCGLDPDDTAISAARKEYFADLISARLRQAWEFAMWPEVCIVQERTPDSDDVVGWEQSGEDPIGEVLGVYSEDPDHYAGEVTEHLWVPTDNGIQLVDSQETGDTVFVKFRRRPSRFTLTEGEDAVEYSLGTLLFNADDGECYQAVEYEGAQIWNKIDFPYLFEAYCVQGAYADYLRHDNQREKAAIEEGVARQLLEDAYTIAFKQQGHQ